MLQGPTYTTRHHHMILYSLYGLYFRVWLMAWLVFSQVLFESCMFCFIVAAKAWSSARLSCWQTLHRLQSQCKLMFGCLGKLKGHWVIRFIRSFLFCRLKLFRWWKDRRMTFRQKWEHVPSKHFCNSCSRACPCTVEVARFAHACVRRLSWPQGRCR